MEWSYVLYYMVTLTGLQTRRAGLSASAELLVIVLDKNGKVLLTHEEENARWVEQFKEVLTSPDLLSRLLLTHCQYPKTCL